MAKGFKHGAGGGASLNFKVVGGTTEPANPSENTIWIDTDTEVTGYVFSATEPAAPVEGMVWISTGTSSPVEFNALKKNGITVYPFSAKQYVGGAWVDKTAKSYQNGAWVEWATYLYNYGTDFIELTGDFSITEESSRGTRTFTKNADSLYLAATGASGGGTNFTVATAKKIDLTQFNTLCAQIKFTNTQYCGFALGAHTTNDVFPYDGICYTSISENQNGIISVDVSQLSGSYYVYVGLYGNAANNYGNCYVYEVYLK